jgi:outer membrane receptor protein involved in Fe transport
MTAFCLPQQSPAQAAAPTTVPDEDTVILDRFVVNTDKDRGYLANSTLGGTRTNTAIKDLANPLDIFTPELMMDLGVQDIQDLTAFANGVETNLNGDHNSGGEEREVWNYNYMQIRGFKISTVTRNFMALNSQFEAYNSERVEFSKGPNAILSGIGDPGGSVNFGTKTPKLHKSSYTFAYRTDDLGSQRVSMDVNQVLLKDQLGLRLNAMWEDEDFYRHPAYERQNAWHLTAQYRPTRKTTIDIGHERRRSERASPRSVFPTDYVTNWKSFGSAAVTEQPLASGNNIFVNGGTTAVTAASVGMALANPFVLDSNGRAHRDRSARGTQLPVNGSNRDTASTGLDYPLDTVIGGPNGINDSDWSITELRISQIITPELQVELAYGRSDNHVRQGNSVSRDLHVDTNQYPGNDAHFGQWYVQSQPFWIDRDFNIEHWRGSASYDLDLTKKLSWWAGRHQFAGVLENNVNEEWSDTGRFVIASAPGYTLPAAGYQNTGAYFFIREYLSPEIGKWSMRDLRDLYYSDGFTVTNSDGTVYTAKYAARDSYAFYKKRTDRDTVLGVLQSRWFGERVITTIGIRKDWEKLYRGATYLNNDPLVDDVGVFRPGTHDIAQSHPRHAPYLSDPTRDSGYSRNYGIVAHVTDWLSLSGNYTTNMSFSSESLDMYGNYLPPATGESTDFGVRFSLLDNRLNISLIKYETNQEGYVTNGSTVNSPFTNMKEIEELLVYNNIAGFTNHLQGVHTTTQRQAKGEELVIVGSITRDWTLRLSASRSSNKLTNIAPDVRAYYLANMPVYKAQDQTLTATDGDTLATRIGEAETNWARMNTREGTENWPASKYNVRLTTKYSFSRTFLKGLSVGGNIRWASAPVIGYYRVNTGTAGSLYADRPEMNGMFDTARYAKGDEQYFADLFFTYQRKIYRDLLWRVQININNLFNETDPYATAAINDKDGADFKWVAYRFRPIDGRVVSLTTSVSF